MPGVNYMQIKVKWGNKAKWHLHFKSVYRKELLPFLGKYLGSLFDLILLCHYAAEPMARLCWMTVR